MLTLIAISRYKSLPSSYFLTATLSLLAASLLVPSASAAFPAIWQSIGPYGGDARSFAADPHSPTHIYLGGTNNWIFESLDDGATWSRLGKVDSTDDLIVDSLIVDESDPHTLFAGVHRVDRPDGGLFVSHDGGHNFKPIASLAGQSVRSLAQAPSDPDILMIGTLEGVFRSADHGLTWTLISPPESKEIHEVESLAIDPRKPDTIYAGTWHLPWKTTDGGQNWRHIKEGVIDDSDVFSIIVDPERTSTVYISACSGIYKSENAGELFHKIQGIPATARRTRVLMQDTRRREIVYAGTTEGLYRTRDAGRNWTALTGPDVIVNDIYLDPTHPGRVLLATDRSGVLLSDNEGASFSASNQGFSARKVEALLIDSSQPGQPARLLAGVVNDKQSGGVFLSSDNGASWSQLSAGLDGRDVFALAQSPQGDILAGTSHGIFALVSLDPAVSPQWVLHSNIVNRGTRIVSVLNRGRKVNREEEYKLPAREMGGRVDDLDLSGETWLAATGEGLLTSSDRGATWQGGLALGSAAWRSVAVFDGLMLAARRESVILSKDQGKTWMPLRTPTRIKNIHKVAFSPDGQVWLGTGDGIYFSRDKGESWFWLEKVPIWDTGDLSFDRQSGRMLATSRSNQMLYSIDPQTLTFTAVATGFRLFEVKSAAGRQIAVSLQDGVLIAPTASASESTPPAAQPQPASSAVAKSPGSGSPAVHPALPKP
jgi:photosystem II stability/assembly factor-like uncharacterized protein